MTRPHAEETQPLDVHEARWRGRTLARPPGRGATEAARRAAAEAARPDPRGRRQLLVAAALGALAVGGLLVRSGLPRSPAPPAPASIPLEEDVLLLWLDPQTPLYLHLQPPRAAGDRS